MCCVTNVEQWRVELSLSLDSGGLGDEMLRVEHVVSKSILYRELSVMMKRVRWEGLQERSCGCEPT